MQPVLEVFSSQLATSIGPYARDKCIFRKSHHLEQSKLIITSDGRTMIQEWLLQIPPKQIHDSNYYLLHLLYSLSKSQDEQFGDGTTSVVLFCCSLLEQCNTNNNTNNTNNTNFTTLQLGMNYCRRYLQEMYHTNTMEPFTMMQWAAKSSLQTKMVVQPSMDWITNICCKAVQVVDYKLHLIKLEYVEYGQLEQTEMIHGIRIPITSCTTKNKLTSKRVSMLLFSCPLEETTHIKTRTIVSSSTNVATITTHHHFETLILFCKTHHIQCIACQWNIDSNLQQLLIQQNIILFKYLSGDVMEKLSLVSNHCNICSHYSQLDTSMIGTVTLDEKDSMIHATNSTSTCCTILVRGINQLQCEDVIRCIHDALCNIRNTKNSFLVPGGGATEVALYCKMKSNGICNAFANALLKIPKCLIKNAGIVDVDAFLEEWIKKQESNPYIGMYYDELRDVRECNLWEVENCKRGYMALATDMASTILKIDQVILV